METIDDETVAAAKEFIQRQHAAGTPFFCWWNGTRMHFRTHVKEANTGISGPGGNEYHDGMVEHDGHVGELLNVIDELGSRNEVEYAYRILEGGSSADRQLATLGRTGDLKDVVAQLIAETADGVVAAKTA